MFEAPRAAAPANDNFENVEILAVWREYKEKAPEEARALLAERVDSTLEGRARHDVMIALMSELNETDPQRYRYVIEHLAQMVSIEKAAAELDALLRHYPGAADSTRISTPDR